MSLTSSPPIPSSLTAAACAFCRESFNETARFWAATYAGASAKADISSNGKDAVALAGLDRSEVDKFTSVRLHVSLSPHRQSLAHPYRPHYPPPPCRQMGFEQSKVVSTLSRLNYRGNNVKNISDNAVLEELLK
jgi:ubiquitin-conjugating enzyme (huntingtin interacting protein 2)